MRRVKPLLFATALLVTATSGFLLAQDKYRTRADAGPYRVVISKPIVGLGYTAGTLFREHEYLSAMFNQLDAEGLEPVLTEVMTQAAEGRAQEDRMLVICRKR